MFSSESNRLMLALLSVIFIGLVLLVGLNLYSIRQVSVQGAAYKNIASGKDILADILPPPAYLIEAYAISLELLDKTEAADREKAVLTLTRLKKEFNERHEFWAQKLPDENLKTLELKDYESGSEFLNRVILVQLPLVRDQKLEEARKLHNSAIAPLYKQHRASVDELVRAARAYTARMENESARMVSDAESNALLLSVVVSLAVFGLGFLIIRKNQQVQKQARTNLEQLNADLDRRVKERTAELSAARDQLAAMNSELEKRVEERTANLTQVTQRLSTVFNSVQDALIIHDLEGRILETNPAASGLYRCRKEEMAGRPVTEFSQSEQNLELAREEWKALSPGSPERKEWTFRGLDGRNVHVEVILERFDYDGQPAVIASVRDVTERRRIDEERRRSEKLSTLGLMAGGVAHDFNNILSGIYGYSELLKLRSSDPRVLQCAERILQCGEQARKIIGGLLRFSRQGSTEAGEYDAHESVKGALELLKSIGSKNIEAKLELNATEKQLFGYTGQLENALLNLFINARDAMPKGGTLTVYSDNVDLDLQTIAGLTPYALRPGKYLRIRVADSGTGMTAEVRARCLDPFFTTKGENGTGLGLASVQGAITEHRGAIKL
jgi:PAS domain S-box-containing protein